MKIAVVPVLAFALVAPVTAAVEKEVAALIDSHVSSFSSGDATTISSTLSDDLLYIGTDPGEFLSKTQLMDEFSKVNGDPRHFKFNEEKRDMRMSKDGTMAIEKDAS